MDHSFTSGHGLLVAGPLDVDAAVEHVIFDARFDGLSLPPTPLLGSLAPWSALFHGRPHEGSQLRPSPRHHACGLHFWYVHF